MSIFGLHVIHFGRKYDLISWMNPELHIYTELWEWETFKNSPTVCRTLNLIHMSITSWDRFIHVSLSEGKAFPSTRKHQLWYVADRRPSSRKYQDMFAVPSEIAWVPNALLHNHCVGVILPLKLSLSPMIRTECITNVTLKTCPFLNLYKRKQCNLLLHGDYGDLSVTYLSLRRENEAIPNL